jgi:Fur family ferric uptake transcriptional regulator
MSRRDDVLAGLRGAPGFVSAQALYAGLRADGTRIGLATVYRVLQAMVVSGEADLVRSTDGEALYRLCRSDGHHHHLLCRGCGRAEEIDAAVVEDWARAVAARHGFVAVEHTVEFIGTCADCAGPGPSV